MNKFTLQIVEDEVKEAEKLRYCLEKCNYKVIGVSTNIKDALGLFYSQKPDMVIVDIFLQDTPAGIDFAAKINENPNTKRPFIFLTGVSDRKIFESARLTAPYSYLLKPYNELELQYAIELALEKFADEVGIFSCGEYPYIIVNECFFIKKRNYLVKVPVRSITHIEVEGRYLSIYSSSGNFMVKLTLTEMLHRLPDKMFIRVNRNTLVNIDNVLSFNLDDDQLILDNHKKILVSRRNRENIIKQFTVFK